MYTKIRTKTIKDVGGGAFKTRVDDAALRVLRSKIARGLVRLAPCA